MACSGVYVIYANRLHQEFPFAGSRMLRGLLAAEGSGKIMSKR